MQNAVVIVAFGIWKNLRPHAASVIEAVKQMVRFVLLYRVGQILGAEIPTVPQVQPRGGEQEPKLPFRKVKPLRKARAASA